MICNLHKITYVDRCPACTKEQEAKDAEHARALLEFKVPPKTPIIWKDNPIYESKRTYSLSFRQRAFDAQKLILQNYGKLVDITKIKQIMQAFSSGHLDDIFYVAPTKGEWANVVTALGGKQGAAYGEQGQYLGVWESYGCTTYSRVDVNTGTNAATKSDLHTMQGILDDSKRIYFHGEDVGAHTLVHEMLHFVCHKTFFERFSANQDPQWKSMNEGVTEYLTRRVSPTKGEASYEDEYRSVKLLIENGLSEAEVEKAYFTGDIIAFEKAIQDINAWIGSINMNLNSAKSIKFDRKGKFDKEKRV